MFRCIIQPKYLAGQRPGQRLFYQGICPGMPWCSAATALTRYPLFSPDLLSSHQISPLTRSSFLSPDLQYSYKISSPLTDLNTLTRSPLLSPDLLSSHQISYCLTRSLL